MADSRDKGKRGEYQIRDLLREKTEMEWERVPGSGGFGASHGLKGDIYLPHATGRMSKFAIEVKWYKDEHLNSNIMKTTPTQLDKWLDQTYREAGQMNAKPMLVFKKDRGDWIVCIDESDYNEIADKLASANPTINYVKDDRSLYLINFKQFLSLVSTEDLVR
ncbi:D14 protein [Vibrio phage Bennett]|uniref:D14 protein n=1 Tax=Vibrio phage Bennett TaxID=2735171 RepID=A0A6M4ES21_9CAUD|nr:RusA-like Holliday junction resolvase [Vibrio phage Bennett]QJQ85077.1 D14 protein [Vibrio phage Bennett]